MGEAVPLVGEVQFDGAGGGSLRAVVQAEDGFCSASPARGGTGGGGGRGGGPWCRRHAGWYALGLPGSRPPGLWSPWTGPQTRRTDKDTVSFPWLVSIEDG